MVACYVMGNKVSYHAYADSRTITFACMLPVSRTGPPCKTEITLAIKRSGRSCDVKPMVVSDAMLDVTQESRLLWMTYYLRGDRVSLK